MFHGERNDNLLTFTAVTVPHFKDSCKQKLLLGLLQTLYVLERKGPHDAAICHVQVVDVGHLLVVLNVEDVDVVERAADHLALALVVLQHDVFLLQLFCLFKPHILRQLFHLCHELPFQLPRIALQNFLRLLDVLAVLLWTLKSDAWSLAILDVVLQAFLMLTCQDAVLADALVASADRVEVVDEFQQAIHGRYVTVRAEVRAIALDNLSRHVNPGEVFVRHHDARVRLPILQQDVVARIEFLDEVVLQQQGIRLRVHHGVFYIADLAHQDSCLQVVLRLVEI